MLYLVVFFLFALVAMLILINTRARVIIEYAKSSSEARLTLSVHALGGLFRYRYKAPAADVSLDGIKSLLIRVKNARKGTDREENIISGLSKTDILEYLAQKAEVNEFNLKIRYGTKDAFSTGIAGGILWTLAGALVSFLGNYFSLDNQNVSIVPVFDRELFEIDLYCIFSIKLVHIILIRLRILLNSLYRKHFGKKKEKRNRR